MRPVDALIDHLKAEQARGKTHVLLDDVARDGLRELYIQARDAARAPAASTPAVTSTPVVSAHAEPPSHSAPAEPPRVVAKGETREEQLASLREQAETWAPALTLGTLRKTMVFATGNPQARLMLVGEAPGHEEERRQEPFVGPAGRKLN